MRFVLYSPIHFEEWSWKNSVETGIGGSETSHVEMAWRLAARGHEVISYAPIPPDCPGTWRGTTWKRLEDVDFSLSGIWVLYRCPEAVRKFDVDRTDQTLWLMMQDWAYPWQSDEIERLDKIIVLSQAHKKWLSMNSPEVKDKIWVTSNGLKPELIAEVEKNPPKRNPKKIMYASSPDRGLECLLGIFSRACEFVPDLELHTYYGFDNIDKIVAAGNDPNGDLAASKQAIMDKAKDLPGLVMHGRLSQTELYREWLSAGMWCYPSEFWETSCITCMEAQALGAIPIITPIWAQGENTHYGIAIPGARPYHDKLIQTRFAAEIARLAISPEIQEKIRAKMMPDARKRFTWENFVTQWEDWANHKEAVAV